jgi:3-oxoacyl-[acyl-carrier protein] reductase
MSGPLSDRRIAVTGASRGLGRAIALACAREGADVGITYRSRKDAAEEVAREVQAHGRRAVVTKIDLAHPADIERGVGDLWTGLGHIDGWVNNAAENLPGLLVTNDVSRIERQISVALLGPMFATKAVVERMMARRSGVILNVSSVAAARPARGQAAYAAAKGGIEAFTRAIAVEYAKKGIITLCLRPGAIATEMLDGVRALDEREVLARIPAGRIASPEEIASLAAMLLGPGASYMTGSVVTADGGMCAS